MTYSGRVARATQELLQAVIHGSRENSLRELSRALSVSLNVRYAGVGELVEDGAMVRIRAIWGDPPAGCPSEHPLEGSPCAKVAHEGFYHYPRDVRQLFPNDPLLAALRGESYVGIPLRTADKTIGILAAVHDQETPELEDLEDILWLYGSRASAELERLQADEQLAASEQRFRIIVMSCQEGIWWLDARGNTSFANPQLASMLGYRPEQMVGLPIEQLVHPEEQTRTVHDLVRVAGGKPGRAEVRLRHSAGHDVWTSMSTTAMRDSDGRFQGALAFVSDMTERRLLEQRALNAQKLESIGMLAGGVAHDFNNLMHGILGHAELARTCLEPGSRAHASLLSIESAADRATDLTRQLLAYAGKSQTLPKVLELGTMVDEMTKLLSSAISKKAQIEVRHVSREARVQADPAQLSQVIMNLIMNASDALDQKPGTISIETGLCHADRALLDTTYVEERLPEGVYAFFKVRDSGRGMDAATQARIFEPFFSTKASGRGLGLAAVMGIVRNQRGAVRVESKPGEGTTFLVLLPTTSAPASERPTVSPSQEWVVGAGSILVADDELLAREICREVLRGAGFHVLLAKDGLEAVAIFRAHADEIIAAVLDRAMPGLSGEQVFAEIMRVRPQLPVVVSSGFAQQETLKLFRSDGPIVFLPKPWRAAQLLSAVQSVLQQVVTV